MTKVRKRTNLQYIAERREGSMKEADEKLKEMHMGRIIHMLSHQMKRNCNNVDSAITNDDLTVMQKHVLKFVLLESLHRDLYQKDIEEEFQIRKSTVTGILKLMESHGYIRRESVKRDARLKRIVPTAKAEEIRPKILEQIQKTEAKLLEGIPQENVTICKQILWQMFHNISEMNEEENKKDE